MGADLYRNSIYKAAEAANRPAFDEACAIRDKTPAGPERDKAQKDVNKFYDAMHPEDGYFRDSYNDSSVLSRVGMSWWRDVIPMCDNKSNLVPAQAAALADRIEKATLELGEGDDDETQAYFVAKRERLVKFLRAAAEAGEPIYCSL